MAAAAGGVLYGALFVSNASAAEPTDAQSTSAELLESGSDEQPYQEMQSGSDQQPYQEAEPGVYEAQPGAEDVQSGSDEQPYQEMQSGSDQQPEQGVQPGAEGQQESQGTEPGGYEAQPGAEDVQSGSDEQPYQEMQSGSDQQPYQEAEPGGYEAQPGVEGAQPGTDVQPEQEVQPGAEGQQESQGTEPGVEGAQPGTDVQPEQEVQPGTDEQPVQEMQSGTEDQQPVQEMQPGTDEQPGVEDVQSSTDQQPVQEMQPGTEDQQPVPGTEDQQPVQDAQPGTDEQPVQEMQPGTEDQPGAEGQQESQGTEPGAYEAQPRAYDAPPYEQFRTVKVNEVDGVSVFQIVEGDDGSQPGVEGTRPGTDEQPEQKVQPGGEAQQPVQEVQPGTEGQSNDDVTLLNDVNGQSPEGEEGSQPGGAAQQQPGLLVQPGEGGEQPVQAQVSEPAFAASDARDRQADVGPNVVTIRNTGPSSERFDVTFVGDGYTASEQDLQRRHAEDQWKGIAESEPWNKYRDWTNVWLVPVVSKDSGVDNDPARGINRDTALDMGFFCDGRTERLLCSPDYTNVKAKSFASKAPGADAIIAMANSNKYGGAGGAGVATVSGGNALANEVLQHELGHSVGRLADEYYTPGTTYSGGEPTAPNVTKDPTGSKWASYLGRPTPDGGVIGAYEGGHQFERGIYRPSKDSMMRIIGKPFNLVSLDAMDRAIRSKIIRPAAPGADTGGGGTA
ncbi:M64 family metallopeptidase [Streptomyces lunaelactis]|uniref:M64 family metallopeptidase n=1 Tax=Streptomyces lunaelactis TaxID=1535768 RepID=UPI002815287F|nr:M64 family metallopeptidase [Streptomyces lunaelactis]